MEILSPSPKTLLLYGPEVHKLHLEFEVAERKEVLTLSADLVAGDYVAGSVAGVSISNTVYAASHAATLSAIAAKIAALATIDTAVASGRTITIVPFDNAELAYSFSVVSSAAGTATASVATTQGTVYPGQPVALAGVGEQVYPLAAGSPFRNAIGISLHTGKPGELITIVMKGHAVIMAKSSQASMVPGPVKVAGFDTTSLRVTYAIASADTDVAGWALDAGDEGADIRVVISA